MPRFRVSPAARWLATLVTFYVLALTARSEAHEATPGVVALKQVAPGRFVMLWSPPSPPVDDLRVRFPAPCQCAGNAELDTSTAPPGVPLVVECGAARLDGTITFASSAASHSRIAVNVTWLDGSQTLLLSSGNPATVQVRGSTQAGGSLEVLGQYLGARDRRSWLKGEQGQGTKLEKENANIDETLREQLKAIGYAGDEPVKEPENKDGKAAKKSGK